MDNVFVLNKGFISLLWCCGIFLFSACNDDKIDQYFEVEIDGVLWKANPNPESGRYNLKYKPLSHQFSILAIAKDSSRIEISFHSPNPLHIGNYPSIKNDSGIQSGIFYFPDSKKSTRQMASITYEFPIQENTVNIIEIDKTNPRFYIIEGTFFCTLYALYSDNQQQRSKLTLGRFKILYNLDSNNSTF